jgi:hypothetical protein
MKMSDLRAKARAIFGPAIAEPMPNQPNGAKALQQRANARPIPTYKVGGVVKKPMPTPGESVKSGNRMAKEEGDEMRFMDMLEKKKRASPSMPTPAESVKSGNRMAREEGAEMKKMKMAVGGKVPAPNKMSVDSSPGKGSPAMSAAQAYQQMYKLKAQEAAMKRASARPMPQPEVAPTRDRVNTPSVSLTPDRLLKGASPGSKEASFIQDIMRQQAKGSPQPEVAPTFKKGGKVKEPKPKNGLAVMIAIGSPKKPTKKMNGGAMSARDMEASKVTREMAMGGAPMGYAAGGAGKTRKGQAPIKKAQGGAAKVRKGMMTPEGDIINVMNKMRGK